MYGRSTSVSLRSQSLKGRTSKRLSGTLFEMVFSLPVAFFVLLFLLLVAVSAGGWYVRAIFSNISRLKPLSSNMLMANSISACVSSAVEHSLWALHNSDLNVAIAGGHRTGV